MDVTKKIILFFLMSIGFVSNAQNDSLKVYKKKVLEAVEVDLLLGYYN